MKPHRSTILLAASMSAWLAWAEASTAADLVTVEAESGTPGTNFVVGSSAGVIYLSNTNNNTGNNPGIPGRVASYSVNFPAAGTYDLYARLRVGAGGANDDSFFHGHGFGSKSPGSDADWILVNSISPGGFTNSSDVVSGSGSAGIQVWKWINLSQFTGTAGETPITFTVSPGNLTQTFQLGGREDGLDLDKFAFGTTGSGFAVSNLDNGTVPPPPPPVTNAFVGPDGIALHRFSPLDSGINADGANPVAGLAVLGGVLCGTTLNGGLQGAGTAFYLSLDGTNFNAFRSFARPPDAANPQGELSVSGNGFFTTSFGGGSSGVGAVFFGQTNGSVSVRRSFAAVHSHTATNSGGASPTALLAMSGDRVYGTTIAGGAAANGTIFSLTTNGVTFSVLHHFSMLDSQGGTNADGAVPWGGLILSGDKLYGTASAGGAGGNGVVFSIGTNGANFTTLHDFSPMHPLTATNADGAMPMAGLALADGTLYGTTFTGGYGGRGTVFSLQTNGSGYSVLHHFPLTDPVTHTNTGGASPCAPLLVASHALYGTASAGGTGAAGTVFAVSLDSGQFYTLHSFAPWAGGTNANGAFPVAPVLRLGNSLFGTTSGGGPGGMGTVFGIPLATPAVITNIVLHPDGSVTLGFLGGPDSTNVIQAAASLTPPITWQAVSTNVADAAGAWQFTESNATNATRFYRSYAP